MDQGELNDIHDQSNNESGVSKKNNYDKCLMCNATRQKCPERHFHRFPKDPFMSDKWANVTEKKWVISSTPSSRYNRFRICNAHFQKEDYSNKVMTRLHLDAVPRINSDKNSENSPSFELMRKNLEEKLTAVIATETDFDNSLHIAEDVTSQCPSTPKTSTPKQSLRTITPKTKRIKSLSSKVYYLQQKFLKASNLKSQAPGIKGILRQIKGLVTPVIFNFIACQLKASCVSKFGRRWSLQDKNLAFQLYLTSPKAYRVLQKHFHLPSKTTLLKCLSALEMAPGFSETVLKSIELVAGKMKTSHENCIITFDEMKLKPGLSYNLHKDIVQGYEHFGTLPIVSPKLATHALVFMVRGLCSKWKQVFGYFFSCESASSEVLKHLLNEGISKLIDCGLNPIAVACDQGPNNQRLYSKELGITPDKPYFFVQDHKIFTLFDPPHLLKCIRNNFKRYPVKFISKNLTKVAYWDHIRSAWEFDLKMDHRMVKKVTSRHIEVDGLSAMNVALAAQVLSQSMASVLCFMTTTGILQASGTADFCAMFDDIFESVNSRLLKHPDQPLLSAVSKSSSHLECWKSYTQFVQSIEFQTWGKKIKFPCLQGWVITLENFFSVVRRRGGNNDHPTTSDFQCRLRMLMAEHVISTCGTANCEPDDDAILLPVEVLTNCSKLANDDSMKNQSELSQSSTDVVPQEFPSHNDINDELEMLHCENAASYVAGFIAKRALSKFECDMCRSVLLGDKELCRQNLFLYFKQQDNVKNGLHFPSRAWLETVVEFGRRFDDAFFRYSYVNGIHRKIANEFDTIPHDWCNCSQHAANMWDFLLNFYVKMMLFYKVKYVSHSFHNAKKRAKKLRKLL